MKHKIKLLQNVKTPKASYRFGTVLEWSKEDMCWIRAGKINHMVFEDKNC